MKIRRFLELTLGLLGILLTIYYANNIKFNLFEDVNLYLIGGIYIVLSIILIKTEK